MYLRPGIRHCSHNNSQCKHRHTEHLHSRIPFPPDKAHEHGGDAPPTTQDDVHRHGDGVAEGEVVEEVDSEEQDDVREPAREGNGAGFEEERGVGGGEVGGKGEEGGEEKLDEGYKKT